jgi:quercetin dioxygenase-like cupin family protein
MTYFYNWRDHAGAQPEKFFKTTLWQGEHSMVGLNCLEPGQTQKIHAHEDADKFYFVVDGAGRFTVGDEEKDATVGTLVVAPAGVPHGVTNNTTNRLSVLVSISPPIK